MEMPLFHPNTTSKNEAKLADRLRTVSRSLLILFGGLLPLLFIPSSYMPFSGGKTLITIFIVSLAVLFCVIASLREGSITLRLSLPIMGIWAVALTTAVSAFLSGDIRDAFFGDSLDSYTALFTLLMALLMTVTGVFAGSKQGVIRLYAVLVFSSILLTLFHVVRLIFGPEVWSFGIFTTATASPVGGWNSLAIFYGLVVLLAFIALQQLPLSRAGRYITMGIIGLSVMMLAIVNFSTAWWILAIVSGVVTLHFFAKNLWQQSGGDRRGNDSLELLIAAIVVLLVSLLFIIAGGKVGGFLGEKLGISFVEVRPSAMATIDLARTVYSNDLLLGSGPNRFPDVWRMHKSPSINQTVFWNSRFDSGYSYILTSFIGTGVVGVIAWMVFLLGLLWYGIKFAYRVTTTDKFWYFIGLSSLVSSLYLWIMSAMYVPSPTILLLTTLTSGIFIATYTRLVPGRSYVLSATKNRKFGLVLIIIAVMIISGVGYTAYSATLEIVSVYQFNKALSVVNEDDTVDTVSGRIAGAFDTAQNDAFPRQIAFYQWSQMRSILAIAEPTGIEQQTFQTSVSQGIEAALLAIKLDPTEPFNHQILGQIYSVLSLVGVEGASAKAAESFTLARSFDPQNPVLLLLEADLALQNKDEERARRLAEEAVTLKSNYTEALFFLAQMDINDGNVDRAITIVNGVVQLEPQNPARRYQLGILLASANRLDEAVLAFEQAIALDPQYANARYFLALGYAEQKETAKAIEQLTVVRSLNESNTVVDELIDSLRDTGSLPNTLTSSQPVAERDSSEGKVTEEDLESDLVTSSNPVPTSETNKEPKTE